VLLVEDEDAVRTLARRILTAEGYTVLEAANGREALELAELRGGQIDLLVTDVVMPGLSGREVADALSASRPALRVLYMSGYTEDTIVHHGVRDPDVVFLDKPFAPAELAGAARTALESGRALKAGRILVVEDDEQLRGLVRSVLSDAGYEVLVATDVQHSLRIAEREEEPIDLLLTDVFMPRMDGRELSHQLSALRPEMRILYMSGKPPEVLLDRGVIASGGRFVQKPFTLDELLGRVRATLAEPRALSA
jgi:two-component system, cell cycle sensor histidine kinase and response regulator CckA